MFVHLIEIGIWGYPYAARVKHFPNETIAKHGERNCQVWDHRMWIVMWLMTRLYFDGESMALADSVVMRWV